MACRLNEQNGIILVELFVYQLNEVKIWINSQYQIYNFNLTTIVFIF
jgi:hypothetical protein